jgi:ureidoglycolate lyase
VSSKKSPGREPQAPVKPGDIYEDGWFHPVLCLDTEGGVAFGISLIDGTYGHGGDVRMGGLRKLSLDEVREWKAKGPRQVRVELDEEVIRENGEAFREGSLLDPANAEARHLVIEPLDAIAFAAFGDVIAPEAARKVISVNDGTAQRFHALGRVDSDGGATVLSIFRAQPRTLPFEVRMLERHPRGSQAFVPLSGAPYLVVVAEDPSLPPRAFLARGDQGVNFRKGTWHHPLLALEREVDFLVVDREGDDDNCDEAVLAEAWVIPAIPG